LLISADAIDALIDWYTANSRDLPWRVTRDPYRILVSEIMLQQTQAERVVSKYQEFLKLFPTVAALADAPASEVIRAWSGLGYNRRALNLQRACQVTMERFGGDLPSSVSDLLSLPGVGPYTAGAVACFAFEQDVGFVDTNIRRVLHRLVHGPEVPVLSVSSRELQVLAQCVVPEGRGYTWNQALMELGATMCRARVAECPLCPVSKWCSSNGRIQAALAREQTRERPSQVPFEQTSRYFRGRIVQLLRQAEAPGLTAAELALGIDAARETGNPPWTMEYLGGLLRDGLVVGSGNSRVLEETAHYSESSDVGAEYFRLPD
jgi:A/G-specific adenine glycosylase